MRGSRAPRRLGKRELARIAHLQRDIDVTAAGGLRAHRQCGRKSRYATKEQAETVARNRMEQGASSLRAYECPYCGGWHLTHHRAP